MECNLYSSLLCALCKNLHLWTLASQRFTHPLLICEKQISKGMSLPIKVYAMLTLGFKVRPHLLHSVPISPHTPHHSMSLPSSGTEHNSLQQPPLSFSLTICSVGQALSQLKPSSAHWFHLRRCPLLIRLLKYRSIGAQDGRKPWVMLMQRLLRAWTGSFSQQTQDF